MSSFRAKNDVHVGGTTTEEAFVRQRRARDATLAAPTLLLPSIQVNMRAGRFPPAEANGVRFLKIPVKFKPEAEIAHQPPDVSKFLSDCVSMAERLMLPFGQYKE